jgi:D-glycero-alpha-D-manno-heptose-7-phosphate kinase
VTSVEKIVHPVVRECIKKYAPALSLEIHHDGDLPARSGIGSSSAFAVGMIHSLLALQNQSISRIALADLAIEMEHDILRENVGWQDQIACALGGINQIEFGPNGVWQSVPIRLRSVTEEDFVSRMVLIYTGVSRNSTDVTAGLLSNLRPHDEESPMRRIMELARECHSLITSSGDLDLIGEMLDESWNLKKSLNSQATNSMLDDWYIRGKNAGALGGKVLGAGGGGFILFWLKKGEREEFINKLGAATVIPFKICHEGATVIYRGAKGEIGYEND